MPTLFDDADIKCPFYISSDKRNISCEGITKNCITKLLFVSPIKKHLHCEVYCADNYEKCRVYKMLEEKYAK